VGFFSFRPLIPYRFSAGAAISILRDQRACYNEKFGGYTFTKFDGSTVTV
jgi:hypothetical protein